MPRSTARRLTLASHLIAGSALLAAAAAVLIPRAHPTAPDRVSAPASGGGSVAPPEARADAETPEPVAEDWPALVAQLVSIRTPLASAVDDAPVADAAPDAADDDEPEPGDQAEVADSAPVGPAPPGWQFVGYARDAAGRYSALLSFSGKQRFVLPGSVVDSFTVESITPEAVIVTRERQRFRMALESPRPFDAATATSAQRRGALQRERAAQLEQQRLRDADAERPGRPPTPANPVGGGRAQR